METTTIKKAKLIWAYTFGPNLNLTWYDENDDNGTHTLQVSTAYTSEDENEVFLNDFPDDCAAITDEAELKEIAKQLLSQLVDKAICKQNG